MVTIRPINEADIVNQLLASFGGQNLVAAESLTALAYRPPPGPIRQSS